MTILTAEYKPWMQRAIDIARSAPSPAADRPCAAAVVVGPDNAELATAFDEHEQRRDPTASCVLLAISRAANALGTWQLTGCTLVTTLEPGPMGAGAIVQARIVRLVVGTWNDVDGAVCSQWDLVRDPRLNHFVEVIPDVLEYDCKELHGQPLVT